MKFPRNARIFRGQLDAAPFAAVFFLLVSFVMLGSFVYTPGVIIKLPPAGDHAPQAGVTGPTLAVAVDANGRFYFQNQLVSESTLATRLQSAKASSTEPLTLIVQADQDTKRQSLDKLAGLARTAGIESLLLAELPSVNPIPVAP